MKIIQSGRQTGKTTKCVEMLLKDPRYILLTFSEREAERIRNHYRDLGYPLNPEQVMYWESYARKHELHEKTKPIVDNIDHVLNAVIGTWVEVGTLTQTDGGGITRTID